MAPNIIGSTFLIAQTDISNNDANNNCKTLASTTSTTTSNATTPSMPTENTPTINMEEHTAKKKESDKISEELSMKNESTTPETSENIKRPYVRQIVWFNVMLFVILHSMAAYGVYLVFAENAYIEFVIGILFGLVGGLGITAGVHRLWSHRAYKAKLPLRIFLMLCQSLAFQNSIYEWTRDHRVHHKFTDTDADPHNSRRGFFFAHMGWLMCKKHPDVRGKGKQIDLSDLDADPVVVVQKKLYFLIMPICCFVVPALFPYFYLGSSIRVCFFVCSMLRYALSLHGTWLVNSAAHFYGMKPYDITISSVESKFVALMALGEGWHNYHHVFPWDYKAAELGTYQFNWTTAFLNFMAKIGQAYDLKSVSADLVLKRVKRTGDGSYPGLKDVNNNVVSLSEEVITQLDHENEQQMVWGWDDKDVCEDDRMGANIIDKKNL